VSGSVVVSQRAASGKIILVLLLADCSGQTPSRQQGVNLAVGDLAAQNAAHETLQAIASTGQCACFCRPAAHHIGRYEDNVAIAAISLEYPKHARYYTVFILVSGLRPDIVRPPVFLTGRIFHLGYSFSSVSLLAGFFSTAAAAESLASVKNRSKSCPVYGRGSASNSNLQIRV
jgi:hypothetical protein